MARAQIKKDFQDIVLAARQDKFYRSNMYANFGDIGVAVKVPLSLPSLAS